MSLEEFAANLEEKVASVGKALLAKMAKPGTLGLPRLLDARRIEHGIPDGAFSAQPVYSRIYVFQVAEHQGETFPGTQILMPGTAKKRKREETPRGVLVGAGARALDALRSNGIELGHIVRFIRLSPWRMEIDNINGEAFYVMVMDAGDLTGSEDLRVQMLAGQAKYEWDDKERCHMTLSPDGTRWQPKLPFIPEDY